MLDVASSPYFPLSFIVESSLALALTYGLHGLELAIWIQDLFIPAGVTYEELVRELGELVSVRVQPKWVVNVSEVYAR